MASYSSTKVEVIEYDDAGNVITTYVESGDNNRVDVILPEERKNIFQHTLDIFLPAGYPQSVTEDYLPYQIYDSLQAFSSSIAGMLSSRAVLEGVGVGDADATPTKALLLSVVQSSAGRVATILFAARLGTALEPECKSWRLAADFFNDTGMLLDMLSPGVPAGVPRTAVLSFASILRALCGVAAGSSKASLSAHFAKEGNLGELNAKDSSQETVISLMGMLAGSLVVSAVSSKPLALALIIVLLAIHLWTNYMAVRSVSMRSLNRQRANVVLSHLLAHDKVLTPETVAAGHERIFELRDGVLRGAGREVLGWARLGVGLWEVLDVLPASPGGSKARGRGQKGWGWGSSGVAGARVLGRSAAAATGASSEKHRQVRDPSLAALLAIFEREPYVLWFDAHTRTALIVLKQDAGPVAQLQAWAQALMMAERHAAAKGQGSNKSGGKQQQQQKQDGQQAALSSGDGRGEASAGVGGGVDGVDGPDAFAAAEAELRLTLERARDMFVVEHSSDDAGARAGGDGGDVKRRGLARKRLEAAGWDLSIAALETRSGSRLQAVGGVGHQGTGG